MSALLVCLGPPQWSHWGILLHVRWILPELVVSVRSRICLSFPLPGIWPDQFMVLVSPLVLWRSESGRTLVLAGYFSPGLSVNYVDPPPPLIPNFPYPLYYPRLGIDCGNCINLLNMLEGSVARSSSLKCALVASSSSSEAGGDSSVKKSYVMTDLVIDTLGIQGGQMVCWVTVDYITCTLLEEPVPTFFLGTSLLLMAVYIGGLCYPVSCSL